VVLLSKYSGVQLEDYCRDNTLTPDQAHSIVRQITCSLAAAEQVLIVVLAYSTTYSSNSANNSLLNSIVVAKSRKQKVNGF